MNIQSNKKILIHSKNTILDGIYARSSYDSETCCLVLPNYPGSDGDINNPIVQLMSDCFYSNGFATLRMNFQNSLQTNKGSKNNPDMSHALDALDWLCIHNPDASSIWVAGYGYGADISLRVAMRRPNVDGFICISPIFNSQLDFSSLTPCPNGLIVAGCEDKMSDWRISESITMNLVKQKGCEVRFLPIEKADKNYLNSKKLLQTKLNNYIVEMIGISEQEQAIIREV